MLAAQADISPIPTLMASRKDVFVLSRPGAHGRGGRRSEGVDIKDVRTKIAQEKVS